MTEEERYDLVIVGAGVGGYQAAIRAGTWGASVALVEAGDIGGTCLNRGCIPTKCLIEDAAGFGAAHRRGFVTMESLKEVLGPHWVKVAAKSPGKPDPAPVAARHYLAAMIARKDEVVRGLTKGLAMLLKKRKVEVIEGRGRLAGSGPPHVVEVELNEGGSRTLRAGNVILATGSRPAVVPGLEPDGERIFDSDGILEATELGDRLVVVGGGILGCEFAYIYGALGHAVTIVEMLDSLVPMFSADAAREVTKAFKNLSVAIKTGTKIDGAERSGDAVELSLAGGETLSADTVLVAVGRKPNTADAGLDDLGIIDERGFARADAHGKTSVPGLYAVGDMNGQCMLAHFASHQGFAAVAECLGRPVPVESAVPWCAYTHPEVALVGMTEDAAREDGREIVVGRFPMQGLGRARAAGDTAGYFKIVAAADTHRVLGVEIVGPHATDLIQEAALAVRLEARLEDLEETMHAHPTFAEGMMEAAMAGLGRGIHF
jgi:dihydrolipoamide dehydrogenase